MESSCFKESSVVEHLLIFSRNVAPSCVDRRKEYVKKFFTLLLWKNERKNKGKKRRMGERNKLELCVLHSKCVHWYSIVMKGA
jgi:hypothetical protein